MAEEKKNIFKKIGDALSSRDEKEELAKAQAELAKAKAEAEKAAAEKKAAEIAEANRKRVEEAQKLKEAAEARKAEFEARKKEAEEEAAKNADIAEHTVASGETLSHIALKYYGHATPPYYTLIYEANKEIIGDNMNVVVPGQVLIIPVLPENLK